MKTLLLILVAAVAWVFANEGCRADSSPFQSYVSAPTSLKLIPAAKASLIKDGMTLKAIVDILGLGYVPTTENTMEIKWDFDDGRELCVFPKNDSGDNPSEVITFKGKGGDSVMGWRRWR